MQRTFEDHIAGHHDSDGASDGESVSAAEDVLDKDGSASGSPAPLTKHTAHY